MQVKTRPEERDVRVDQHRQPDNDRPVPISFFDLLADDGWEPLDFFQGDPTFYWNDGGFIANAPVDIAATLDGAIWRSTNVEPAFLWQGRRIRADFTVPKRHVNHPQLMIVVGGRALDRVEKYGINMMMSLGKHTNDEMTSFYVYSPELYAIEFGWGGLKVDGEQPTYEITSGEHWGHKFFPPPAPPTPPAQ